MVVDGKEGRLGFLWGGRDIGESDDKVVFVCGVKNQGTTWTIL